jgi:hypothetical protein
MIEVSATPGLELLESCRRRAEARQVRGVACACLRGELLGERRAIRIDADTLDDRLYFLGIGDVGLDRELSGTIERRLHRSREPNVLRFERMHATEQVDGGVSVGDDQRSRLRGNRFNLVLCIRQDAANHRARKRDKHLSS